MNLKVLNELEKILTINNTVSERKNGLFKDKTFLVTGKLNEISRAEVKSLIEENYSLTIRSYHDLCRILMFPIELLTDML